jgi:hypothetical protein
LLDFTCSIKITTQKSVKTMFSDVLKCKLGLASAAASIMGGIVLAPAAQAINLVPQQEGEVQLSNLDCLSGSCMTLDNSIFKSVISEKDSSTGGYSYLFVDRKGTENIYPDTVNGGTFVFNSVDLGTTEPENQYWFRPVATNKDGQLIEKSELEVGTFTFEFTKKLSELTLSFFDTEKKNGTSFTVFRDDQTSETFTVAKGPNSNIQTFTVQNVQKITLNLGERHGRTGDGVNFQATAASVPEPSMALGAIATVIGGGLLRKRGRTHSEA